MRLVVDVAALRRARLERGLSQVALAAASGVHHVSIARIETGEALPRPSTVRRLADALGVQVTDIARIEDGE